MAVGRSVIGLVGTLDCWVVHRASRIDVELEGLLDVDLEVLAPDDFFLTRSKGEGLFRYPGKRSSFCLLLLLRNYIKNIECYDTSTKKLLPFFRSSYT